MKKRSKKIVTLFGWYAGQTISLSVLPRNANKGLDLEISWEIGSGGEKEGPKEVRGQLVKEDTESSRQRTEEETSWREIAVQGTDGQQKEAVGEDSQKWVGISSSFVEVSRKIPAHDSLQMHEKLNKFVTKLPFLRLELTQVHIVRFFFFSHSVGCIFCGRKELWNTPAEPTRWITGQ